MPKSKPLPTQQELHELFDYSVITGELYWKKDVSPRARKGGIAGTETAAGYKAIKIDSSKYLSHRLIWCWVTGEDPGALTIDHINGDKTCSAWHNLRLATVSQNACNRKKAKGYQYVKKRKGTKHWRALIWVDGKNIFLGYFLTEAEAAAAHKKASLERHGEFSPYTDYIGETVSR